MYSIGIYVALLPLVIAIAVARSPVAMPSGLYWYVILGTRRALSGI